MKTLEKMWALHELIPARRYTTTGEDMRTLSTLVSVPKEIAGSVTNAETRTFSSHGRRKTNEKREQGANDPGMCPFSVAPSVTNVLIVQNQLSTSFRHSSIKILFAEYNGSLRKARNDEWTRHTNACLVSPKRRWLLPDASCCPSQPTYFG